MKPDKYQFRCLQTWFDDSVGLKDQHLHAALGLASEAGELASLIDKKYYKPGKPLQWPHEAIDELGDVFYNVVILAYLMGITIDELEALNAEKLRDGHGWSRNLEGRM